jgi:hypothetical protein
VHPAATTQLPSGRRLGGEHAKDSRSIQRRRPSPDPAAGGIASVGFYGSILAGMILYAALHPNPEVNYASADLAPHVSAMKMAHH